MESQQSLAGLEQKRLQLEKNVTDLRASLRHWQQWEIEYEGMKEDLAAFGEEPSLQDLQDLESEGEDSVVGQSEKTLLSSKERKLLLYENNGSARRSKNVVDLLTKRIEYVERNVRSVLHLLDAAEKKLEESNSSVKQDGQTDEPLTEIHEELDDDGNLVTGSTYIPNNNRASMGDVSRAVEARKPSKVIADNEPEPPEPSTTGEATSSIQKIIPNPMDSSDVSPANYGSSHETRDSDMSWSDSSAASSPTRQRPRRLRKRVSFAEGTKAEDDPSEHPRSLSQPEKQGLLEDVFAQVRQEMAKSIVAKNLAVALPDGVSPRWTLPEGCEGDCALPILKLSKNRQAKRLLKSYHLTLWEASRVLYKMAETNNWDLDSPQIAEAISQAKKANAQKPNSRKANTSSSMAASEKVPKIGVPEHVTSSVINEQTTANGERSARPGKGLVENGKGSDLSAMESSENTQGIEKKKISGEDWGQNSHEDPSLHVAEQKPGFNGVANHTNSNTTSDALISSPVMPKDEPPEEAALRSQMLQYNMKEVGAVVAELDIDDDDDYEDEGNEDNALLGFDASDDEDDEDEDEHGRTISRVVNGDYIAEMQALERKLKAGSMVNVGREPALELRPVNVVCSGHNEPKGHLGNGVATETKPNGIAKTVRFAEDLDVQEVTPITNGNTSSKPARNGPSITERPIIERKAPETTKPASEPKKRPSRFKASRQADSTSVKETLNADNAVAPAVTKKRSLANAPIVERSFDPSSSKATKPDNLSPEYLQWEVEGEYDRLRNRMIGNEGGFSKTDEEDVEEGGKKMSRFRAARLGLQ